MERVTILAALPWECACAFSALQEVRRGRSGPFPWWEGFAAQCIVRVVRTGIGMQRASDAFRASIAEFPCDVAINTGCAGGLTPALEPGSLIIADEIIGASPELQSRSDHWRR
jgi:nucleoside phosphorylase